MSRLFGGGSSAQSAPAPAAPPPPMPDAGAPEVRAARTRAAEEARTRGGRGSTVLTTRANRTLGSGNYGLGA